MNNLWGMATLRIALPRVRHNLERGRQHQSRGLVEGEVQGEPTARPDGGMMTQRRVECRNYFRARGTENAIT